MQLSKVTATWIVAGLLAGSVALAADQGAAPSELAKALKKLPPWLLENQPCASGRYTFGNWRHFKKDDPLLPSVLLGPVRVMAEESER